MPSTTPCFLPCGLGCGFTGSVESERLVSRREASSIRGGVGVASVFVEKSGIRILASILSKYFWTHWTNGRDDAMSPGDSLDLHVQLAGGDVGKVGDLAARTPVELRLAEGRAGVYKSEGAVLLGVLDVGDLDLDQLDRYVVTVRSVRRSGSSVSEVIVRLVRRPDDDTTAERLNAAGAAPVHSNPGSLSLQALAGDEELRFFSSDELRRLAEDRGLRDALREDRSLVEVIERVVRAPLDAKRGIVRGMLADPDSSYRVAVEAVIDAVME